MRARKYVCDVLFGAVLVLALPSGLAAPRADSETVADFLGRVTAGLTVEDTQPKTGLSFPGGTVDQFLLRSDFVRRFKTSIIVSGSIQDKRIGACRLKAATLEEALLALAKAFECTIIAEKYAFRILSLEDAEAYMQRTKEPFVLVATGGRAVRERDK